MGAPELLVLIGLVLFVVGILTTFLAILRASPGRGRGGAAGLVLVGPVPVVFWGRGSKLISIIIVVVTIIMFSIALAIWLGVLRP